MKGQEDTRRIVKPRDDTATDDSGGAGAERAGTMGDAHATGDTPGAPAEARLPRTPPPQTGGAPTVPAPTADPRRHVEPHLGGHWTGETAPDQESRDNPPSRGGDNDPTANDAF